MRRGELASALRALAASQADPARLARGRRIARDGAVGAIVTMPGRLIAHVRGSRPEPYEVVIGCRGADDDVRAFVAEARARGLPLGVAVDEALAEGLDVVPQSVVASCSCPDWEAPCKHAVALLFEFAEVAIDRPSLVLHWRDLDVDPGADDDADALGASLDRRAVARALLDRIGPARPRASSEPEDDPFFTGGVPASGPVLDVVLTARPAAFRPGQIVVEGVDAGAVLAELLSVIAENISEA